MRVTRYRRMVCFSFLILFSCLPLCLQAQTEPKEFVAGSIQSSIVVEKETWQRDKPTFVTVKVTNISDHAVNLLGIYSFELTTVGDAYAMRRGVTATAYWSPVNISSGTPLELKTESEWLKKGIVVGKVPRGAIHLEPKETKAIKFELSQLHWNKSISSTWPYEPLFEVVPKGSYDLSFDIETDTRKGADDIPRVSHVASNSVRITIE